MQDYIKFTRIGLFSMIMDVLHAYLFHVCNGFSTLTRKLLAHAYGNWKLKYLNRYKIHSINAVSSNKHDKEKLFSTVSVLLINQWHQTQQGHSITQSERPLHIIIPPLQWSWRAGILVSPCFFQLFLPADETSWQHRCSFHGQAAHASQNMIDWELSYTCLVMSQSGQDISL